MDFETLTQKYDFRKIKNGYTYNGAKLQITEIKRKDGDPMTRKAMIKLCDSFLAELREKYPHVDGLVSLLNTRRGGTVQMYHHLTKQSIISPQVIPI